MSPLPGLPWQEVRGLALATVTVPDGYLLQANEPLFDDDNNDDESDGDSTVTGCDHEA